MAEQRLHKQKPDDATFSSMRVSVARQKAAKIEAEQAMRQEATALTNQYGLRFLHLRGREARLINVAAHVFENRQIKGQLKRVNVATVRMRPGSVVKRHGGLTIAYTRCVKDIVMLSTAWCCPTDVYTRLEGRLFAARHFELGNVISISRKRFPKWVTTSQIITEMFSNLV